MAPKKRRSDEGEGEEKKPVIVKRELMVTRSSSRRLNGNSSTDSLSSPKPKSKPRTKKTKTSAKEDLKEQEVQVQTAEVKAVADGSSKTIVIEHCKQCNSFKTRAIQVKNGLESGLSGVNVLVNPEKPRRGCFEIREEGGEKFISLLDMKRPFTPMKALDMDKVISDVIDKIK
ncbi:Selenoprotein H [Camellia lanceoleosa]|uniref:Selenoprotein H n=1 Tax=Camellia lanceoleosa TaxID=1840588 RepID=A0ACC0GCX8_9ERIC|nr:Selenoprotein H [Camellia lanceoleosa]